MTLELHVAIEAAQAAIRQRWDAVIHNRPVPYDLKDRSIARIAVEAAAPVIQRQVHRDLRVRIQDLEHELRLARQHLERCPTWQAVCDHDRDKARENA